MEPGNQINSLAESLKEYARLQYEIMRLRLIDIFSSQTARLTSTLVFILLLMMILLLLTAGAGLYLGDILKNRALGFVSLAGIYVLLLIILSAYKEKLIRRRVRNTIISHLSNKDQ